MNCFFLLTTVLSLVVLSSASFSGPFLFWGHKRVVNLQPRALIEATEADFSALYKDAKAVVVFLRNSTGYLDCERYPKFQKLIKRNAWAYLPQHVLVADPINYNANVEVITLSSEDEDNELLAGFNDAVTIYGEGEVLGILGVLANRDDDVHFIAKREARAESDDETRTTTPQPSGGEETDESFVFVADGRKAILYLNATPILNFRDILNDTKLVEHKKAITFDDQRAKGYGRLNIIYTVKGEKLFLRFNFSLSAGNWAMKAVEVEYKEYKNVLPLLGNSYDAPYAPLGFSYRCSTRPMRFVSGEDSLIIRDFQVQPWLNGSTSFGDVYDCVGLTTAPILAGILVSLFLCAILSLGLLAIMDIKTPNRFENSQTTLCAHPADMFVSLAYGAVNTLTFYTLAIELFLIQMLFVLIVLYIQVWLFY